MDDLGFNKIAGAVLATGLGMLLLMKIPGLVMAHADEGIAYKVGSFEAETSEAPVDLPFPQADWIEAMDAAKGAKVFNKCKSCHTVEPGGAHGTGPALYGVVENDIATNAGYEYSAALTGLPADWNYEALDEYLKKPNKYAPGTKMSFFGLKKPADRAAVIEYLRVSDATPAAKPVAVTADPIDMVEAGGGDEALEDVDPEEVIEQLEDVEPELEDVDPAETQE